MNNIIESFKKSGLLSKSLVERLITKEELAQNEAPPSINPDLPQSDVNISGKTDLPVPLAELPRSSKDEPSEEKPDEKPVEENDSSKEKSQKEYLFNALDCSLSVVEACASSLIDSKCFESISLSDQASGKIQEMLGMIKEWKSKMSEWSADVQNQTQADITSALNQPEAQTQTAPTTSVTASETGTSVPGAAVPSPAAIPASQL
jgi:hypothetical protein